MILECITGPDDFIVGSKIVNRSYESYIKNDGSYFVYEVMSPIDHHGRFKFKCYETNKDGITSLGIEEANYRVADFGSLTRWIRLTEYMPYDPKQQGDTDDDI